MQKIGCQLMKPHEKENEDLDFLKEVSTYGCFSCFKETLYSFGVYWGNPKTVIGFEGLKEIFENLIVENPSKDRLDSANYLLDLLSKKGSPFGFMQFREWYADLVLSEDETSIEFARNLYSKVHMDGIQGTGLDIFLETKAKEKGVNQETLAERLKFTK